MFSPLDIWRSVLSVAIATACTVPTLAMAAEVPAHYSYGAPGAGWFYIFPNSAPWVVQGSEVVPMYIKRSDGKYLAGLLHSSTANISGPYSTAGERGDFTLDPWWIRTTPPVRDSTTFGVVSTGVTRWRGWGAFSNATLSHTSTTNRLVQLDGADVALQQRSGNPGPNYSSSLYGSSWGLGWGNTNGLAGSRDAHSWDENASAVYMYGGYAYARIPHPTMPEFANFARIEWVGDYSSAGTGPLHSIVETGTIAVGMNSTTRELLINPGYLSPLVFVGDGSSAQWNSTKYNSGMNVEAAAEIFHGEWNELADAKALYDAISENNPAVFVNVPSVDAPDGWVEPAPDEIDFPTADVPESFVPSATLDIPGVPEWMEDWFKDRILQPIDDLLKGFLGWFWPFQVVGRLMQL